MAEVPAQEKDRRNKGVFWELGFAIKENDPADPTGQKKRAVCKCVMDRDNPEALCNKHTGISINYVLLRFVCLL
jgi:hypothetical protein